MNPEQKKRWRNLSAIYLWILFGMGNACLFITGFFIHPTLWLVFWMGVTGIGFGLTLRYVRHTAHWRFILVAWGVYSAMRGLTYPLQQAGAVDVASLLLGGAFMIQLLAWFAMFLLAIRQDVSGAYMTFCFITGPILFSYQLTSAGGLVQWVGQLQEESPNSIPPFTLLEPIFMALSCMSVLAIPCFVGHFIWLWIKEYQKEGI